MGIEVSEIFIRDLGLSKSPARSTSLMISLSSVQDPFGINARLNAVERD